jgi:eukaryotic-like serine/threonine-protein kinase
MVTSQERVKKARRRVNNKWRIIWLSLLGLVVIAIILFTFNQCDILFGVHQKAASSPVTSADWSMFRRDLAHTGDAGPANALPAGTLAWTFKTGAPVNSSPAVYNGTVYFGSEDHNLYAVDALTGAQKWVFQAGSFIESSPVVVSGVVYFGCNDGKLYALNAATGAKIWEYSTVYSLRSSPAVADGVVYIGGDDYYLYAVRAATGKLMWKKRTGSIILAAPAVNAGLVVAGSFDGICYTFDAKSGRVRLQYYAKNPIRSSAAVRDTTAYVIDNGGQFLALDIRAKNWLLENKIRSYWNALYLYGVAPKPSTSSGYIWSTSLGFGISSASSPALSGNYAYFGADKSVESIDLTTHKVQWTFPTDQLVISSPAVADSAVYFGGENGKVYALDKATGTEIWEYTTGGQITSSPALANGMLYITSQDGTLYAFK